MTRMMNLAICVPNAIVVERTVEKIVAEGVDGHFCLLPRHIDFVALLVPGILLLTGSSQTEEFLAIDEGLLVKCGNQVSISTRHATPSGQLGELQQLVKEQFRRLDEREQTARLAVARLEAGLVRRFVELEKHGRR